MFGNFKPVGHKAYFFANKFDVKVIFHFVAKNSHYVMHSTIREVAVSYFDDEREVITLQHYTFDLYAISLEQLSE